MALYTSRTTRPRLSIDPLWNRFELQHSEHHIDRDVVVVPDVVLESEPNDLPRALRPMFDAVWNACGLRESENYDQDGYWRRGPIEGVAMETNPKTTG